MKFSIIIYLISSDINVSSTAYLFFTVIPSQFLLNYV